MTRNKMPREMRAKQFMPFDALKGLKEEIGLREYEHDREQKGDLSEEMILKISNNIRNIKKDTLVSIEYFSDGHKKVLHGKCKVDLIERKILIDNKKIDFIDILNLSLEN